MEKKDVLLNNVNKLEGLADLFDMAASDMVEGSAKLGYCGMIGVGHILRDIVGELGELDEMKGGRS